MRVFEHLAKDHTVAIIGAMLGDEGKGRFVDTKLESLLAIPGVEIAVVVRFNGGNNSGHTVEGLDLHVVPSSIMYPQAVGIIDQGAVIHPEDFQTEVEYVEEVAGDTRGKLFLSEKAIVCTDIERAEEVLNRIKSGAAKGGTGRGVAPSYAHNLDRTGKRVSDLMTEDWKENFSKYYEQKQLDFSPYGMDLADVLVPDFKSSHQNGRLIDRPVGTKEEFLDRLENARSWIIDRQMVTNTFLIHESMLQDMNKRGVIFEGAQAQGLHPWLGTFPDVTASDPSIAGIISGTALWRPQDIKERIGILKVPYTSSVGVRRMPTHIELPKNSEDLPNDATPEQKWAARVREEANEYGTTTGRPRDINFLDLPLLAYNARMSGIEVLAATHLDIARAEDKIKVCTHYTDANGKTVLPYQPGLVYLANVRPNYIELPGWDGEACRQAKSIDDLPENALKFLAYAQARTGYPIVAATTGPKRENLVALPGYNPYAS